MKIEINLEKKYFIGLLSAITLFALFIGVVAYNPLFTGGNPAVFGHSLDELEGFPDCGDDEVLKHNASIWECVLINVEDDPCVNFVAQANGFHDISLLVDDNNICENVNGCSIVFFLEDGAGIRTKHYNQYPSLYTQDSAGRFVYWTNKGAINGDSSEKHLINWGNCDLFDDYPDELTPSKESLVLRDSHENNCGISICAR